MSLQYKRVWACEQPIVKQHCQMFNPCKYQDIAGHATDFMIRWARGAKIENYVSKETVQLRREEGKKLLDKRYSDKILQETQETIQEWWKTAEQIRKRSLQNPSQEELVLFSKKFSNLIEKVFAYFIVSAEDAPYALAARIRQILEEKKVKEIDATFNTLTTPHKEDLLQQEKASWLTLIQYPSKENLKKHMLNFPFLFCNIDSEKEAFTLMQEKMKEEKEEKIKKEIEKTKKRIFLLKEEQEKLLKQFNSEELQRLTGTVQKLMLTRLELKNCWSGMHYYLFPFFEILAQQAKVSTNDILMFYTPKDIINLTEKNQSLPEHELTARKQNYIYIYEKGNVLFFSGNEAVKAKKKYLDPYLPSEKTELTGMIANKGKVVGKVRILDSDDLREISKIAKEVTKETILVTGMTNPNSMVLIEKVGGIITDEGGVTCHAAIVSREFNLPCVVGTSTATQLLKNGDEIELDADNGIVKILKRA